MKFVVKKKVMSGEAQYISSTQNPKIKHLLALQEKSSERRKSGLFVVEGRRELQHCVEAGYQIDSVFVNDELGLMIDEYQRGALENVGNLYSSIINHQSSIFSVSRHVYERIAYRGSTEGIVAIVRAKPHSLEDLLLPSHLPSLREGSGVGSPLFVILESVEKPGNLGAVLRSADAAGATAVIVCDPLTDLYNPNLIRASIGACFTVPMVACSSEECIRFLKDHGVQILTAQLQDSELYYDTDMTGPTAIVMGTESTGLTDQWRQAADAHIRIPMLGRLDSLNVSVSAAILLFEAVRQREILVK